MSELAHGMLLQEQGRLEEAEACFYRVLAREPENDFVHGRLALCQMSQVGKKRQALERIDEAIRLRADEPFYHAIRALILSDLHRGEDALEAADRALALHPEDSLAHTAKAAAYVSMDRWADAEACCHRALAQDPDNVMAANLLTQTLRLQGKNDLGADAAARLLAASPEDSLAHVNAGWIHLQRGDREQAESHFREALRLDPDSDAAREGLLEAFRARSPFYRAYLAYGFYLQRFTEGKQWAILIGLFLLYQLVQRTLASFSPLLALFCMLAWLAFVLWVWLAPGVGNFLIWLDSSARLALKKGERNQGLAVGGGLFLGLAAGVAGYFTGYLPLLLGGAGLITSTVPAALAFDNESRKGRWIFGGLSGFIYLGTLGIVGIEALRFPGQGLHPLSLQLMQIGLLAAVACTWLGNLRPLRRAEVQ